MSGLVAPHGGKGLTCCLLGGGELEMEKKKAGHLKKISVSAREKGDLIMMGIGGFSPLNGFMTRADWKEVCDNFLLCDGTFWPIPVTLSVSRAEASGIAAGDEIALLDPRGQELLATMRVTEKYPMTGTDKKYECEKIFMGQGTASPEDFWKIAAGEHPGVQMVMNQGDVNLAGPVRVVSQGEYPAKYPGIYLTPEETRKIFQEKGWRDVAALQLRNPMHRSHEYLCKIAVEVCDGVFIHSLVGNLKPGDIPAEVRVRCIDALIHKYFVSRHVLHGGYPLDMRYAGPREALLHATFRQNYGCSRMIIGRDHAGIGNFYGLFEAQTIFDRIPYPDKPGKALICKPLKIDLTFYCHKCDGMASLRTCPHAKEDRVALSGTALRKFLSAGDRVPDHFGRAEVFEILREYYGGLAAKTEIRLHRAAAGEPEPAGS
ncbi:MAG: sulfate adenylyltransferase [Desulfobacterales bacterium]|nr:sulfate adenylyltransferase [Desulfobacterales bacterium]